MTRIRFPDFLIVCSIVLLGLAGTSGARAAIQTHTVTNYLTHCGGCHGIEGISGKTFVPTCAIRSDGLPARQKVGITWCAFRESRCR
ncbi:hypothetical protein [Asaia platycodi]|uniref:hypothetical protein n=1 Tax=Asaia platycodi TaxID=610243 RepID=UPI000A8F45BF|nr:hypothetical protein [Asaia platycodi]